MCVPSCLISLLPSHMNYPPLNLAQSFLWQRYYAMLVGGAVLGFAVIQQVLKGSPQSSQQLRNLSKRLDNIGRRVSISPTHSRASMGPGLSPILIQESSGIGELPIDEPDYAPPQEAAASAVRRSSEVSWHWRGSNQTP